MPLRINNNIASLSAQKNLTMATNKLGGSFEKLSSGLRITKAADDAAGLAISERMRADVASFAQASRNASDGISLVQTAEGALNEISSILTRMRELAVQSSNGTFSNEDKDTLDNELQELVGEIDRISQASEFNGTNLLDGSSSTLTLQVGKGTSTSIDQITVTLDNTRTSALTIDSLDIGSGGSTSTALTNIDAAINEVARVRGQFGAAQNRLQSTVNNLAVSIENLQAAESGIRDVDVAEETSKLTRNSIIQQAAISILAQANVQPQAALSLLG